MYMRHCHTTLVRCKKACWQMSHLHCRHRSTFRDYTRHRECRPRSDRREPSPQRLGRRSIERALLKRSVSIAQKDRIAPNEIQLLIVIQITGYEAGVR